MRRTSRRDFLKVLAATPAAYALSRLLPKPGLRAAAQASGKPNVIVLLFDALSASNLSLYGYHRKTTPNLERFAERANDYRAHYATANFTVPGTASLLTGLYPWTHRGINLSGLVRRSLVHDNIFETFGAEYDRLAFGQNIMAENLLNQFRAEINDWLPSSAFSLLSMVPSEEFARDPNTAYQALDHFLFDFVDAPGSLMFGLGQRAVFERLKRFKKDFPRGLPQPHEYPLVYRLQDVFNGLMDTIDRLQEPHFSYLHIFSPHEPYTARRDFIGIFNDGWTSIQKPESPFSEGESFHSMEQNRVWYDEYVANVDYEFGRFLDHLEQKGALGNTWLVVTSDHGEMFERGLKGHVNSLLYEPLVRVPLLISAPGQTAGKSIEIPTSAVDVMPTLLAATGHAVPPWVEGTLLPELGGEASPDRPVYMIEAKSSSAFGKLTQATFAMRKGPYKTTLYRGYDAFGGKDSFELYDVVKDPEEMQDLYSTQPDLAGTLRAELLKKFEEIAQAPKAA